jgi:hypothetical protein
MRFSSVEINASDFNQHFINTPIELTKNIELTEYRANICLFLITDQLFMASHIHHI